MDETPKTLLQAVHYFADVDTCNDFMRDVKWSQGRPICQKCGYDGMADVKGRPALQCNRCRAQTSYKVGTIFEDSPLPLAKWFVAVWYLANCRNGISSHELGRAIGVTQKTAWFMLHRIRCAMHIGQGRKLDGEVESDETYVGGKAKNMHKKKREREIAGRGSVGKTPVQAIVQRDGDVRTFVVGATDAETLRGNILRNVEKDASLYTDDATATGGLAWAYRAASVNHSAGQYVSGRVHTNTAENFFSLLKRAIKGTYIAVSPWHLFRYAQEQGFRYNVRDLCDFSRFLNALRGAVGKRLTYRQLAAVGDAGFMGLE